MQTLVKITVHNGDVKLKFAYTSSEFCENEAKNFIFDTLNKIVENQNKLKTLGVKNNFFGLSAYKENYIDIDIVKDSGVSTYASGLSFKFSKLQKVENKKEAFNIIFDTHTFMAQNKAIIE